MALTTLIAPSHICIYHDIEIGQATVRFLKMLLTAGHEGPLELDLRATRYVSGAAALMLFAHVNFLQLKYGSKNRVKCLFPTKKDNPGGHDNIVGTQLSRALMSGTLASLEQLVADEVPFQSSNDPTSHANITVGQLTKQLKTDRHTQLISMLGGAISEAVLNVRHHAYAHAPEIFSGPLESRWWQYARFDAKKGRFIFLIYDLGLGILRTYMKSLSPYRLDPDTHILEEALSFGFSRHSATQPERGCGSDDLKHPINLGETLLICCNDLRYVYRGANSVQSTIERTLFKLDGNLLEWTLKVDDVQKEAS